jgi:drug/metabolite transporter (DMT)-like permease
MQSPWYGLNPWTTLYAIFAITSLCMLAFNLVPGGALPGSVGDVSGFFWLSNSAAGWGALLLLAGGLTLLGYGLYNVSLKHLPSSVANLVLTIEPLFTALVAYFVFGEVLTTWQLAGLVAKLNYDVYIIMGRSEDDVI